ncbi:MAG: hypothetical protein P4L86_32865, partial [Mycobacterium sp.]|nr:hypothetical protein [Mycobacterium sp.]
VAFTPTDTTTYNAASATVTLTINKVTPTITWATPAAITNGTALSATQLNATASVPGTFVYSPAAGTVLAVGSHTLSVAFTPTDATDYNTASATVTLTVKASPTITWATPAAINYGTALSATQLNATASVPGTFVYSPAAGAVLNAGTQTLSTTFTPTDTATYGAVTATVSLTVNKVTPTITWATPAAINYGTALSATQLNATASVPGTFSYSPAAGSVLAAGAKILTVTFLATDQADYGAATATVTLTVNQAVPAITWATPSAVAVGTVLSATQLNATASVPGSFVYSPALGTAITTAGTTTLSTTFTPTDITDYASATASVSLSVVPGFSVAGTAVTVTAGAATSNTSTVTVTPTAGFTGSVTLQPTVTNSTGTQYPPTVSFGSTSPVSITSTTAGTATLTVTTTASKSSCSASYQAPTGIPWYAKGGAVLACVLLFGIAPKRRKWRTMLGMLLLFVALASGMMACGGGSTSTACNNVVT